MIHDGRFRAPNQSVPIRPNAGFYRKSIGSFLASFFHLITRKIFVGPLESIGGFMRETQFLFPFTQEIPFSKLDFFVLSDQQISNYRGTSERKIRISKTRDKNCSRVNDYSGMRILINIHQRSFNTHQTKRKNKTFHPLSSSIVV